jgi:hypothetical protein
MVSKYYVAIRPQTNEHHVVHKEDCPFLPDNEKRIYLGMFNSGQDAVRVGQRHFIRTKSCPFCLKEYQQYRRQPVFSEIDITGDTPTDSQISLSLEGNLFYFLN